RLGIENVNSFRHEEFSVSNLDISKDFTLKFKVQSYRREGSTRYGIAWNFKSSSDFLLFTIHTKNGGYYSIGPGNNSTYIPYSRFKEGSISLNAESTPDELQIKKIGGD